MPDTVPVTGDKKMKNMDSDLEYFPGLVGKTYIPYHLIGTLMEAQTKQNKHSSTKSREASNWGNQKRLHQGIDIGVCVCVQIIHTNIKSEVVKENIQININIYIRRK